MERKTYGKSDGETRPIERDHERDDAEGQEGDVDPFRGFPVFEGDFLVGG